MPLLQTLGLRPTAAMLALRAAGADAPDRPLRPADVGTSAASPLPAPGWRERATAMAGDAWREAKAYGRDKTLEALGTAKGVVTQITETADTVMWVGDEAARLKNQSVDALGGERGSLRRQVVEGVVDGLGAAARVMPGAAALASAAEAAEQARKARLVDDQGRPSLTAPMAKKANEAARWIEAKTGSTPKPGELLTPMEIGELKGSIGSQVALSVVGAEEVKVALNVAGAMSGLKGVIEAVRADPKGWHKNTALWTSLIGMALSILGLKNTMAASKIVTIVLKYGWVAAAIPPITQMALDATDKSLSPQEREKRLKQHLASALNILKDAVMHAVDSHGKVPAAAEPTTTNPGTHATPVETPASSATRAAQPAVTAEPPAIRAPAETLPPAARPEPSAGPAGQPPAGKVPTLRQKPPGSVADAAGELGPRAPVASRASRGTAPTKLAPELPPKAGKSAVGKERPGLLTGARAANDNAEVPSASGRKSPDAAKAEPGAARAANDNAQTLPEPIAAEAARTVAQPLADVVELRPARQSGAADAGETVLAMAAGDESRSVRGPAPRVGEPAASASGASGGGSGGSGGGRRPPRGPLPDGLLLPPRKTAAAKWKFIQEHADLLSSGRRGKFDKLDGQMPPANELAAWELQIEAALRQRQSRAVEQSQGLPEGSVSTQKRPKSGPRSGGFEFEETAAAVQGEQKSDVTHTVRTDTDQAQFDSLGKPGGALDPTEYKNLQTPPDEFARPRRPPADVYAEMQRASSEAAEGAQQRLARQEDLDFQARQYADQMERQARIAMAYDMPPVKWPMLSQRVEDYFVTKVLPMVPKDVRHKIRITSEHIDD